MALPTIYTVLASHLFPTTLLALAYALAHGAEAFRSLRMITPRPRSFSDSTVQDVTIHFIGVLNIPVPDMHNLTFLKIKFHLLLVCPFY